jgi:hypothetical protein
MEFSMPPQPFELRAPFFGLDNIRSILIHFFRVKPLLVSLVCLFLLVPASVSAQVYPFPTESSKPGGAGTPGFLDKDFKSFLGTFSSRLPDDPLAGLEKYDLNAYVVSFIGRPDIRTAMVQADGKILIGGTFRIRWQSPAIDSPIYASQRRIIIWRNLARLNADGTLDTTFISPSATAELGRNRTVEFGPDGAVYAILVNQTDGDDLFQYLVAGDFLNFSHNANGNSVPRKRYLTLQTLEPTTRASGEPLVELTNNVAEGDGFNSPVRKLRRLIGSSVRPQFTVADQTARLNGGFAIGDIVLQLDNQFIYQKISSGSTVADWINLPAGRQQLFFATGDFTSFALDTDQRYITRFILNANGITLPIAGATASTGWTAPKPNRRVWDVAAINDRIFFVGEFTSVLDVNSTTTSGGVVNFSKIASISENGILDTRFNPDLGFNNTAMSIVADPIQNNLIVGGYFTDYDGNPVGRIARINVDGSFVPDFPAPNEGNFSGANGPIRCVTRQPDGRLFIAGEFTSYNGIKRSGLARLEADGSLDLTFSPPGNASGIQNFAFDIDGGPATASLFGRPIAVGNFANLFGSEFSGVARFVGGSLPVIWYQPSQIPPPGTDPNNNSPFSILLGSDTTLSVVATDNFTGFPGTNPPFEPPQIPSEPLLYQWQKNGKTIEGEVLPYLNFERVSREDLGTYRVWVWNSQFGVLSDPVQITQRNPFVDVIPPEGLRIEGIISPNSVLGDLGGSISLQMNRSGLVTGTVQMAGTNGSPTTLRVRGQYNFETGLAINIPVPNRSPLRLQLITTLFSGQTVFEFTGFGNSLSDTFGNEAAITASNVAWSKANPATAYAGKYAIVLESNPADLGELVGDGPGAIPKMPQGFGSLMMQVTPANGQARISGMLSDGTKITAASYIRADQESSIPLWIPLYKAMGALTGQLGIQPDGIANPVQAQLQWSRPADQPAKAPNEGFLNVALSATASSGWLDPKALSTISSLNLDITDGLWSGLYGAMELPINQPFVVNGNSIAPQLPNDNKVTLKVNASSGLATGTFEIADPTGALRKVKFQGIMTTATGSPQINGFFIMPNLVKNPDYYIGGSVTGF